MRNPQKHTGVRREWVHFVFAFAILVSSGAQGAMAQQKMDKFDMARAEGMLKDARDAVKKNYYDPNFHGIDIEATYKEFDNRIKQSPSLNEGMRIVAAFLDRLKDSHTYFIPPSRPYKMETGFRMQLIGENAFITSVRPDTDAALKVHPGDQVLAYNTYSVNPTDFRDLSYAFGVLMPQLRTSLALRAPDGTTRQVVVDSKTKQGTPMYDIGDFLDMYHLGRDVADQERIERQQQEVIDDVTVWKMPLFVLTDSESDHLFETVRKHNAVVLDLRGNGGGAVVTLERLLGNLFDHDVKIADRIGRRELKPEIAKTIKDHTFRGKIIVLVDSMSASAAEIFARIMQLEHRGVVIGDRTSGSVMEAELYPCSQGLAFAILYAFSVTEANLVMSDGKSLEGVGVTPDEIVLPTAQDLAAGRDPALARAVELAGGKLDADRAGKLFPIEWLPFQ